MEKDVTYYYSLPILFFFIFEIIYSFNIGYFEEGLIVLDREKIK